MRSFHRFPWRLRLILAAALLLLMAAARAWAGGTENTATGTGALTVVTTGSDNTADGFNALHANASAGNNTAVGANALLSSTTGGNNTATGSGALRANTTGHENTAAGVWALHYNTTGTADTAMGHFALEHNTSGGNNTALGFQALSTSTTGSGNLALGSKSLLSDTTGYNNAAAGFAALFSNTTGNGNIAIGASAGSGITTGSYNIEIGASGSSNDSGAIVIGTQGRQIYAAVAGVYGSTGSGGAAVYVAPSGQLFMHASSARFKTGIRDMQAESDALYALRPVAYQYRPDLDPAGTAQYGLVAEEVERINPALVVHGEDGKPDSVRYEQVNAMLLNEFLKEHARVQAQAKTLARQQADLDGALEQIRKLTDGLQKVNAEMVSTRPAASGGR